MRQDGRFKIMVKKDKTGLFHKKSVLHESPSWLGGKNFDLKTDREM